MANGKYMTHNNAAEAFKRIKELFNVTNLTSHLAALQAKNGMVF